MSKNDTPRPNEESRCGFVALLGAPNAGKSTLLNRLVGEKVSIVTPKVQTTRSQVRGVALQGDCQIIYVDTPGVFAPAQAAARARLDRAMVDAAWRAVADADAGVALVDARQPGRALDNLVPGLAKAGKPAVLALNKIDLVARQDLLAAAALLNESGVFDEVFMISALTGDGTDDLQAYLAGRMPTGVWHYPPDQVSDLPLALAAAEITREKAFMRLHQELPYALTVQPEQWQEFDDGSVRVDQMITVRQDSQKGIVIGQGGQTIKAIRSAAQEDLADMLGRRVHLFVRVKVSKNWSDDRAHFQEWGLSYDV